MKIGEQNKIYFKNSYNNFVNISTTSSPKHFRYEILYQKISLK